MEHRDSFGQQFPLTPRAAEPQFGRDVCASKRRDRARVGRSERRNEAGNPVLAEVAFRHFRSEVLMASA